VFDVGLPEFLVLAVVAIFVFGPDRLPDVARQAGRLMRQLREMVTAARTQLSDELGPEFADYDIKDMNPRNLVRKHLLDDLDDDETPVRPGHRPLKQGEQAPYDSDAT
jgi:sec-independent protein translocase protein TatB